MKTRSSRLSRFFIRATALGACLVPASLFAQSLPAAAPNAPAASAPPPAITSAPTPAVPASRPRLMSPEIAARLAETTPKFSPPKSEPAAPAARPADQPKNGIVRLPDYIVRETPPPAFKPRELLTPSGKLDLAFKRRPGLRFGSLPFLSNNGIALAMLEEDFALERAAELKELGGLNALSETKKSK